MLILDGEFTVGVLISVLTIALHALATVVVVRLGRVASRSIAPRQRLATLIIVMAAAGTLLMVAHLLEVAVWAVLYALVGVTSEHDAYYFAFVNFTTLGYGDLLPVFRWRVLGPMTAANGMLLFGWSTAVLFAVLSRALRLLRLS